MNTILPEPTILTQPGQYEHNLKTEFDSNTSAWWLSANIDIYNCNKKLIRDREYIQQYVNDVIELIDMTAVGPTHIEHFWDQEEIPGYSVMQLIETSNITSHFDDKTDTGFLDIFSCKYYDPYEMAQFTQEFFKAQYVKVLPIIRHTR